MGIVSSIRHRIARARCILAQSAKAQGEAKAQARARLVAFASACARRRRTDPVDKSACGSNPIRSRSRARNKPNASQPRADQTRFAPARACGTNPICSQPLRGTNPICFSSRTRNKPNLLTAPARNKLNLLQFAHAEQTQFASSPERGANPIEATENLQQSSKTCRNVQESSAPRSREKTKRTHYAGSCTARAGLRVRKLARPISENFRKLPIPHDSAQQSGGLPPLAGWRIVPGPCATDCGS
jgi:hypothetical protein